MFVGAITSATIMIGMNPQLLDRNALVLVIEGITTGAQATISDCEKEWKYDYSWWWILYRRRRD